MSNLNPDELLNKGNFQLYCDLPVPLDSTFLIIGQARAGTSMVSKLLNELGVSMGEKIGPVYEDNELGLFVRDLSNGLTPSDFIQSISKRNNLHQKWGWKRPDLYSYLEVVLPNIRNPRIICCLRDVVAISARNRIALSSGSGNEEIESVCLLNEALEVQKLIFEKIEAFKIPSLLISYEKAFSLPENFLLSLVEFTGLSYKDVEQDRLLNMIQPNHRGYSLRARRESFGECASELGILRSIQNGFLNVVFKLKCDSKNAELWRDGVKVSSIQLVKKGNKEIQEMKIDISDFIKMENHFFELKFDDGKNFLNSPYFWGEI
jgi:hypothetical protein